MLESNIPWCFVDFDDSLAAQNQQKCRVLVCLKRSNGEAATAQAQGSKKSEPNFELQSMADASDEIATQALSYFQRINPIQAIEFCRYDKWDDAGFFDFIDSEQFSVIAFLDPIHAASVGQKLKERAAATHQIEGVGIYTSLKEKIEEVKAEALAADCPYLSIIYHAKKAEAANALSDHQKITLAVVAYISLTFSDPTLPFHGMPIPDVKGPEKNRPNFATRNDLLGSGVSTLFYKLSGDSCVLERLVSTSQREAWRSLNVALTLSRMRFDIRERFRTRYSRAKLVSDNAVVRSGQSVISPSLAKAELISLAQQWADEAILDDIDAFKAAISVSAPATKPGRLEIVAQPNLVKSLINTVVRLQFK